MYVLELDFCVFTKPEQQLRKFNRRSNKSLFPLQGTKNPLKFASLLTCGFVAQLVVAPKQNLYLGRMSFEPSGSQNIILTSIFAMLELHFTYEDQFLTEPF